MHGRGACAVVRHVWWGCVCVRLGCMAGEMATAADGTHPTGMHSCYDCDLFITTNRLYVI